MSNHERLAHYIGKLEHERSNLLDKLGSLKQAQLDFAPSRQSWSIGQVIHHIGLGEKLWQGYLAAALKDAGQKRQATVRVSLEEVPFSSRIIPDILWRNPIVLTPLSLMIKYVPRPLQSMLFAIPLIKMDAGPRMQPKAGLPRDQLRKFLDETREATLRMVQPVAEWDLTRVRIVHPLVGDQDVYGILELLASHEQRHSLQIESIKKNTNFP